MEIAVTPITPRKQLQEPLTMLCNIYLFDQREWFVIGMSQTTFGVWVGNGRVTRLPGDVDDNLLSAAVTDALASSRKGVGHPTDWKEFRRKYKESLGVTNVSAFERKSLVISVQRQADRYTLTPHRTEKNGHMELPEALEIVSPSVEELAAGIRECLGRCRMAV